MTRRRPMFNPRWNAAAARPPVPQHLVDLLAGLRAAYLVYRNAHWQMRGGNYYGNHLLMERIYKDAATHVDQVAERIVGYYGSPGVELSGHQARQIQTFVEQFESGEENPIERSLAAAQEVQRLLKQSREQLQRDKKLSMGWDDLLMSIASAKDEHVMLLQQVLDGNDVTPVRESNPRVLARRLIR